MKQARLTEPQILEPLRLKDTNFLATYEELEVKRQNLVSFGVLSSLYFSSELDRNEPLSSTVPKVLYCKLTKLLEGRKIKNNFS
jgi:hypothetical protein